MAENTTITNKQGYLLTIALLALALVITTVGWIGAASQPVDEVGIRDRLRACEGLQFASEDPECESALRELEGLLVDYSSVLTELGSAGTAPEGERGDVEGMIPEELRNNPNVEISNIEVQQQ